MVQVDQNEAVSLTRAIRKNIRAKKPPLGTPDDSPASFHDSSGGSASGSEKRKRVEFSSWTNVHGPPSFSASSPNLSAVRPLPPSRECVSSSSILKASSQPEPAVQANDEKPQTERTLIGMLESLTNQLASNDRTSNIDAYQTLSASFKAYSGVPDPSVLKLNMSSLLQFIRRDLLALENASASPSDTNLVTQALKVLIILVWNRSYSSLLGIEQQAFILDRAIQVIEEHSAPKAVIIHYLHLLSTQDFRQGIIMANNRATRLVDALKALTTHVKGNGAVSERLMVYQRLLDQAGSTMKLKAASWLEDLLEGLINPQKDIKLKAIDLGAKVVSTFTSSSNIAQATRAALDNKVDNDKMFGSAMCRRLERMVSNAEEAVLVPQIWAIVISLLKAPETRIESWNGLRNWLKVIQKCFNCSNSLVRTQANLAWNRFVYVVRLNEASESLIGMLMKPILAQMERKGADKEDRSSRATAFSAYCNLVYYAFRPATSHHQYDRVWNEYISKVMTEAFLKSNQLNVDRACRMLMAMLWNDNSKPKLWREIRALESSVIDPEELPTIDSKWIRAQTASVLPLFKLLFQHASWGSEGSPGHAFVSMAWTHFSKALGDACRIEIMSSNETVLALTEILSFLADIWGSGPKMLGVPDQANSEAFLGRFHFICMAVLTEIGPLPFVEGTISAARTSENPKRNGSPFAIFIAMLNSVTPPVVLTHSFQDLLKAILHQLDFARLPLRARIRRLRQCICSMPLAPDKTTIGPAQEYTWRVVAAFIGTALSKNPSDAAAFTITEMDELIGDVLAVLQSQIAFAPLCAEVWANLVNDLILSTDSKTQINYIMASVADRLILYKKTNLKEEPTGHVTLLAKLVLPLIDSGKQKSLNGRLEIHAKNKGEPSSLFQKVLGLVGDELEQAYCSKSMSFSQLVPSIIDITCQILSSVPPKILSFCLHKLEVPFSLWLEDPRHLLTAVDPVGAIKLVSGRKLAAMVITRIGSTIYHGANLDELAGVIAAGFASSHSSTINQMIEMWNKRSGLRGKIVYPPRLRAALKRIKPFVELETPGFDAEIDEIMNPPAVMDSQDDRLPEQLHNLTAHATTEPMGTRIVGSCTELTNDRAFLCNPNAEILWKTNAVQSKEGTVKTKLRRKDSQLDYMQIESSPYRDIEMNSQFLTERQKEVRARREAEPAVVFPDLISRPLPKSTTSRTLRDALTVDIAKPTLVETREPATPTLPVYGVEIDEAAVSSPTPQAKQQALRLDDIEVPSSPPSMSGTSNEPVKTVDGAMTALTEPALQFLADDDSAEVLLSELKRDSPILIKGNDTQGGETQKDEPNPTGPEGSDDECRKLNVDAVVDAQNPHTELIFDEIISSTRAISKPDEPVQETNEPNQVARAEFSSFVVKELQPAPGKANITPATQLVTDGLAVRTQDIAEPEAGGLSDEISESPLAAEDSFIVSTDDDLADGRLDLGGNLNSTPQLSEKSDESSDVPCKAHDPAFSEDSAMKTPIPKANSDELDILSASQLSQDLTQHIARESEGPQREEKDNEDSSSSVLCYHKRKRPIFTSSGRKKRRKSAFDSPQDLEGPFHARQSSELYDCIVLNTHQRTLPDPNESPDSQKTPESQTVKRRGRPKRRTLDALKSTPKDATISGEDAGAQEASSLACVKEEADDENLPTLESSKQQGMPLADTNSGEEPSVMEIDRPILAEGPNPKQVTTGKSTSSSPNFDQEAASVRPDVAEKQNGGEQFEHDRGEIAVMAHKRAGEYQTEETDVMGSLSKILEQLKQSNITRPALREIDNLLFEIRTEAQNAIDRKL